MNFDHPVIVHERNLRRRGYSHYPSEEDADGPVPPALLVPNCCCGAPALVKQSRHPKITGRAYYKCRLTYDMARYPYESQSCWFFKPPLQYPPITVDERMATARRRIKDPPLFHCGVCATLVVPPCGGSPDNRPKYSTFFQCSLKTLVSFHLYSLCIILIPICFHAVILFAHNLKLTKLAGWLASVSVQ
ncbi:hypothetical protein HU200_033359 [Digitaria exilis]|uniref:Uncharacterized protein n=1 Tax=Digitaria exilis TaxID=1010633 RepID=A0A835BVP2_9POAL|nr:hypothetical protein HU200_033359 [Digitaria exilis]